MAVAGDGSDGTDASVDLTTFQQLLDKLEGSKKRQQRQKSVEGRRDVYAQGLASMMGNFWSNLFKRIVGKCPAAISMTRMQMTIGLI